MKKTGNTTTLKWISIIAGMRKLNIIILLLMEMVLGIIGVYYAVILRNLIDVAVAKDRQAFFFTVAIFIAIVIAQIVIRAGERFLDEYTRATIENQCKRRLFSYLLYSDYAKVSATHSGEWMNRLTSDTVVVADGLTQIVPGIAGMLVRLMGALIMILVLEPRFGYLLIPFGIVLVIFTYGFRKVLKRLHKGVQEADGRVRVFLQESLGSMLVVKAFAKEESTLNQSEKKLEQHKKARMKKNHFANICNIGFGGIMNGANVFGAAFCGYGILMGTMSYGTFMAILQLIAQVQSPFANITGYLPRYYAMIASAERLMEVEQYEMDGCSLVTDNDNKEHRKPVSMISLLDIKKMYRTVFQGLSLSNIGFTYQPPVTGSDVVQAVLANINIEIKKGEYIAFTGPSGCGKSTILKLLMCLYPLNTGKRWMVMDKTKVELSVDYRRLFAYVPQGNHLMSGTIRQIITFFDPSAMQEDERIWEALSIASADTFVNKLEQGIDTVLGERGMGLSEGQLQRIAIARAIFSDNPILMLDESTSALDEQTEKQLLYNLRAMTDKTVLIVTHRLAVLDICDKEIRFSKDGVEIHQLGGSNEK